MMLYKMSTLTTYKPTYSIYTYKVWLLYLSAFCVRVFFKSIQIIITEFNAPLLVISTYYILIITISIYITGLYIITGL